MKPLNVLFVAYYYPPAGGAGLPGCQRTVKFIRNMKQLGKTSVLSVNRGFYADNILQDFDIDLPLNDEKIVRAEATDFFEKAMNLRKTIKSLFKKNSQVAFEVSGGDHSAPFKSEDSEQQISVSQKIKDFVHYFYYLPDLEAPWIRNAVKEGVRLVRENDHNIIFATGSPWSSLVIGKKISKKTGVPFIADFRDPWMGNPFRKSKGKIIDWLERRLEKSVVSKASLVTANTEPLRDEFLKRYSFLSQEKTLTLPNGFDLIDFKDLDTEKVQPESSTLTLAHAGFLYGKRDPAPLLDAMEMVFEKWPELKDKLEFHQIGDLELGYSLEKRYENLVREGHVKRFKQMPYQECLELLSKKDVLVLIQPGTKTQVPSKLYDYLCLDKPILTITPKDGALGKMIGDHGLGDLVEPENIDILVETLRKLCEKKNDHHQLHAEYPSRDKFDVKELAGILQDKMREFVI